MHSCMFTPSLHTHTPHTHRYYFKISTELCAGSSVPARLEGQKNHLDQVRKVTTRKALHQSPGCKNSPYGKKACVHMSCGLRCPCPQQCPVHSTLSMADAAFYSPPGVHRILASACPISTSVFFLSLTVLSQWCETVSD